MPLFAWSVSVLIVVWWTLSSQTASAASCTSNVINFTSGDTLFVDACALGPVTLNMASVRRCENILLSLANIVIDRIVWPDCATSLVNVSVKLERCHVGEFGVLSVSSTLIRRVSVTLQNSEVNMTVTLRSPTKAYSIVGLVVRGTSAQAAMDSIDVRCLSTRVIREPPAVGLVSNISVVEPLFSLSGTRSPSAVTVLVDDSEFDTLEMLESRYKYLIWRLDFPLITSAVLTVTRSRFHHVVLPLRNGTTIALFQFVTTSAAGTSTVFFTWRDCVVVVNASSLMQVDQPAEVVEVKLVLWGGPSTQYGCQWLAERIHANIYTSSEGHLFYLEYGTRVNASMVTVRDVELTTWRRGVMPPAELAPIRAFVLIVGFLSDSIALIERLRMITDTSVEATQAVVSIVSANRFANSTVTIVDSTSRMIALEGSPFTSGFTSSLIGITTVSDGSIVLQNVTVWNVFGPTVQPIGAFAAACVTIETCATCVIRLRNVHMTSNVANAFQGTLYSLFRSAASFLTFGAPPGKASSSFTHSVVQVEESTFAASEFFVDACTSVGYTNINVFNNTVRLHNVTSVSLPLPSSSSSAGEAVVPQLRAFVGFLTVGCASSSSSSPTRQLPSVRIDLSHNVARNATQLVMIGSNSFFCRAVMVITSRHDETSVVGAYAVGLPAVGVPSPLSGRLLTLHWTMEADRLSHRTVFPITSEKGPSSLWGSAVQSTVTVVGCNLVDRRRVTEDSLGAPWGIVEDSLATCGFSTSPTVTMSASDAVLEHPRSFVRDRMGSVGKALAAAAGLTGMVTQWGASIAVQRSTGAFAASLCLSAEELLESPMDVGSSPLQLAVGPVPLGQYARGAIVGNMVLMVVFGCAGGGALLVEFCRLRHVEHHRCRRMSEGDCVGGCCRVGHAVRAVPVCGGLAPPDDDGKRNAVMESGAMGSSSLDRGAPALLGNGGRAVSLTVRSPSFVSCTGLRTQFEEAPPSLGQSKGLGVATRRRC